MKRSTALLWCGVGMVCVLGAITMLLDALKEAIK
jgi:hypothetical protein